MKSLDHVQFDRHDFSSDGHIDPATCPEDPFELFDAWMSLAIESKALEPYAMTIITADPDGQPHGRIVYLRNIIDKQLVFYSNYESDKGREMAANEKVALLFFWPELKRQVRVEGLVHKASKEVSDTYFKGRPRRSQLGAWASAQSHELTSRDELEAKLAEYDKQFEGREVPRPENWGGYMVTPNRFEFWLGQESRLHDRVVYTGEGGSWNRSRISP